MARFTLATIVLVIAIGSLAAAPSAQRPNAGELSNTPDTNEVVDWGLLDFYFGRKITGVRILFTADGERFLRESLRIDERGAILGPETGEVIESRAAADVGFRYETTDPMVLEMSMSFLEKPLRIAFPDREEGGVGMGDFLYHLAEIDIIATKGRLNRKDHFSIGVTSKGFCLGRDFHGPRNVFYSWGLAKVLDDIIFEKTAKRLPGQVFRRLSGEAIISGEKRRYEMIRQRHRSDRSR